MERVRIGPGGARLWIFHNLTEMPSLPHAKRLMDYSIDNPHVCPVECFSHIVMRVFNIYFTFFPKTLQMVGFFIHCYIISLTLGTGSGFNWPWKWNKHYSTWMSIAEVSPCYQWRHLQGVNTIRDIEWTWTTLLIRINIDPLAIRP